MSLSPPLPSRRKALARAPRRLPPPPPGFELDGAAPAPEPEPETPPPPPEGFALDQPTGEAVDGDTLRMENGGKLRMFGIDAPELKQQGWDRQGNPVPIGQNSRVALDAITTPNAIPGPQVGSSYGRPVAPVTDNGLDLGEQQIRTGNALAAPSFMEQDAARRFRYMQAERLARLNRLGINQTYMQSPQDFRRDPIASPERETIAQFWDTPTPDAGMRPEDEARYVELLRTSDNADEIVAFARGAGRVVDPADVAKWLKDRAEWKAKGHGELPAYANYVKAAPVMTDQGDGAAGAGARGLANGVLPNFLEETGAIVDTLGGTNNRENIWNSDRRLADIYANNAAQNEAITRYDAFAHPYVTTGSQIAGGLVVPMGRVSSAADLAKFGAGYGALSGLGREGSIPERLTSGAVGAGEGLALTVGGGKALEAAAPYVGKGLRYAGEKFGIRPYPNASRASADVPPPPPGFSVDAPRTDVAGPPNTPAPAVPPEPSLPTGNTRQRDWIDVGSMPPPPPGFQMDNPRSIGMDAERGPSISQDMPGQPVGDIPGQPYPISQPMSAEQLKAATQDIRPSDLVPIPSNEVGSVEELAAAQAGRYAPAKPVNEATALESRTITAQNGRPLPKRGPSDLVTWLRTQGGIKDQGGNLRAMGIDNAPRDLDFARGEQRFGKLVNDETGMNLDDAARKAWEAGYLPGLERPDINAFLDAIDRTHSGAERFFHPDDLPEVQNFEGMRADRQQLEEQLAQGPVHVDRSVPADEPQPFPPPQAYEEWPAGGPDFAGNINLNKLHTPQDIKRALSTVNNHVGFDAATRGRVSQVETERLASELGMTPETLLARRRGQAFNAEEALAARQINAKSANELTNIAKRVLSMENPGDDLLAQFSQAVRRHAAIQEQVSGMTAEVGRTLAQFRMIADSKAVNGEVLARLVDMNGGRGRLQDAARAIVETVETEPGKFNPLVEKLAKPRWIDKALELRYNMMLSGPQTHAANVISNSLTAISQLPEYAAASAIGMGRRAVRGAPRSADRVYPSEVASRAFGLLQGTKAGLRQFVRTLKTGETSDLVTKVESQAQEAISGLKGKIIRTPSRALSAEDELFKAMARNMDLYGLADRAASAQGLRGEAKAKRIAELVANPPDEMLSQTFDYARYVTFQRPLSGIPQSISAFTNKHPVVKLVVPFVRTPTNLLKYAAERSPAAPLIKEWRADFMAGGARRDLAIAKATVGSGIAFWVADLAQQGLITGSTPSDKNKANLMRADGWQPYSIRVGDKWMSYSRLDPFAITMGTAADIATKRDTMSPRQLEEASGLLVASIIKNMGDKTWLSGLSDMFGMLGDPQRNMGNYIASQAASLTVPAIVSQTANAIDPTRRESDGVAETVQARLPGLKSSLPPQRNVFGEPVVTDRLGPDLASPVMQSKDKNDPVVREMLRLGSKATEFPKGRTVAGKWVKFTPQEYDRLQAKAGQSAHQTLTGIVSSPMWKGMTPDAQRKVVEDTIKGARASAKAELFGEPVKATGTKGAPRKGILSPPPPPAGFKVDGEAAGVNVYADLQKAIPGIRFTSGFRDYAYNQKLKAQGYPAADNTTHMDGNTLDMLPPPGKSLGWLQAQVRRQYPKADLLVHAGHLHGRFPGWYGAPVLGGAKRAGLRNPRMGMPAPPPGFKVD